MTLATLGNGAAVERFDDELARVLENIVDPNTDWKAVRRITLQVTLKPNEERSQLDISIACAAKVQPAKVVRTFARLGIGATGPVAVEDTSRQMPLFPTEEPDKVTQFPTTNGGAK